MDLTQYLLSVAIFLFAALQSSKITVLSANLQTADKNLTSNPADPKPGESEPAGATVTKRVTKSEQIKSVKLLYGFTYGLSVYDEASNIIFMKSGSKVYSVDYHWKKNYIFFTFNNYIYRGKFKVNCTDIYYAKPILEVGVDGYVSLAVDWVHDRLYWLSTTYQTVEVSDLDGNGRTLLVDNIRTMRSPNNIVVDPYSRSFFFVSDYAVFKSNLNGKNIVQLPIDYVNRGNKDHGMQAIALDIHNKRLYLTGRNPRGGNEMGQVFLEYVDYDGFQPEDFNQDLGLDDVVTMTVFNEVIFYATDGNTNKSMFKLNLTDLDRKVVFSPSPDVNKIFCVRVMHPFAQQQTIQEN